jgi:hypothetical protein
MAMGSSCQIAMKTVTQKSSGLVIDPVLHESILKHKSNRQSHTIVLNTSSELASIVSESSQSQWLFPKVNRKKTPQKKNASTCSLVLFSSPDSISSLAMLVSLEELQAIVRSENILHECGSTREVVFRCCLAFRESGRFEEPISHSKSVDY